MKKIISLIFPLIAFVFFAIPSFALADTQNFTASNVTWDGTTLNFDTDVDMTAVPSGDPGPFHILQIFSISSSDGSTEYFHLNSQSDVNCTASHCTITNLHAENSDSDVSQVQLAFWDNNDEFVGQSQSVPWTPVPPLTAIPTPTPPTSFNASNVTYDGTINFDTDTDLSGFAHWIIVQNINNGSVLNNQITSSPAICTANHCSELIGQNTGFSGQVQILVCDSQFNTCAGSQWLSFPFAFPPTPTPATTYNLSGNVYNDNNQNGVQDNGETGYQGATISLDTGQSTTTDSNGNYSFLDIEQGSYTETLTLPDGYSATTNTPVNVSLGADTTQNFGIFSHPVIGTLTTTPNPVKVNSTLSTNATFTEGNTADTHTATWNWGDGHTTNGTVTESNGSGSVTNTHSYTTLGSYTITLTVINNYGVSSTSQKVISVIPTGGLQGGNLAGKNYSGADLSGQNISGGNLSNGTFNNVNFSSANLSGANGSHGSYTSSNFTSANLSGGNFNNANFTGANFTNATLTGTNLSHANFTGANVSGATFTGANKTGIIWSNTICPNGQNSNTHNNSCVGQGGGL